MALEGSVQELSSRLQAPSSDQRGHLSSKRASSRNSRVSLSDGRSERRASSVSIDMSAFDTSVPLLKNHKNKIYKEKDKSTSKKKNSHDRNQEAASLNPVNARSSERELGKLDTAIILQGRSRSNSDLDPQSVIHAPEDFKRFSTASTAITRRTTPSPAQSSVRTVVSRDSTRSMSTSSSSHSVPSTRRQQPSSGFSKGTIRDESKEHMTLPLRTDLPILSVHDFEDDTPLAQTRQDMAEGRSRRSRAGSDLGGMSTTGPASDHAELKTAMVETQEEEYKHAEQRNSRDSLSWSPTSLSKAKPHLQKLEVTLSNSWALCNNLANLGGVSNIQDPSWHYCWKLCQFLYQSRVTSQPGAVTPLLELFRDLCKILYEGRRRLDESTDSVLRTLWDLQSHLFISRDANFGDGLQERTLDFYVTLCHRLMRQQYSSSSATEQLLRACWSFVEALYSLRQDSIDGKPDDEDHLSAAVSACVDLGMILNKGRTQSERATPRVSQMAFTQSQASFPGRSPPPPALSRSSSTAKSQLDDYDVSFSVPPETPTTIFDDNPMDALDEHHNTPNILVLGTKVPSGSTNHRWSSSSISNYTESSQNTSPTAVTATAKNNNHVVTAVNLTAIHSLLVKAAIHAGFRHPSAPRSTSNHPETEPTIQQLQSQNQALLSFVESMPPDAFGPQPWQTALVEKYKRLVEAWPEVTRGLSGRGEDHAELLVPHRSQDTAQIAGAVGGDGEYAWLGELSGVVFGGKGEGLGEAEEGKEEEEDEEEREEEGDDNSDGDTNDDEEEEAKT